MDEHSAPLSSPPHSFTRRFRSNREKMAALATLTQVIAAKNTHFKGLKRKNTGM